MTPVLASIAFGLTFGTAQANDPEMEPSRIFTVADDGGAFTVAVGTAIAVEFAAKPGALTIWELKETPPFLDPVGARPGNDADGILRVRYIFHVEGVGVGNLVFHERSGGEVWQVRIAAE